MSVCSESKRKETNNIHKTIECKGENDNDLKALIKDIGWINKRMQADNTIPRRRYTIGS